MAQGNWWQRLIKRREPPQPPEPQLPFWPYNPRQVVSDGLETVMLPVNDRSQPNINPLTIATRNLDILTLNVKAMGYELARRLSADLALVEPTPALHVNLGSKLSTQADIESGWFAHWCRELQIAPFYHRKLWENAWMLQILWEAGVLVPGKRGVGFGCGLEPMPSYFAALGIDVLHTDLPADDERARQWSATNQHANSIEQYWHSHLVDRDTFLAHVSHRDVDMNHIPDDITGYDFTWSTCAFEHLGTIENGLAFVENTLKTLKPGGVAVHTTEFNINPDGPTIDNWPTVFFQRKHFEALAARLEAKGHRVHPLNFDPGDKPLDQFIDLPPWGEGVMGRIADGLGQPCHIKVGADGFIVTCIGFAVTKAA